MSSVADEIAMTLLEDLGTAVKDVLKTALPSLPVEVEVMGVPQPRLVVTVRPAADPVYPNFIKLRQGEPLKLTPHYRRLLGLPEVAP